MSECPNVMTLNRYVSGALEQHIADDLTFHLAKCERCQRRVDQMANQPDTLVQVARRSSQQEQIGGEPQLAELIAEVQRFAPNHENTIDLQNENNSTVNIRERAPEKNKHRVADLDSFIICLRKSGLVDELEIDRRVSSTNCTTTETFADELVNDNVLTAYQGKILSRGRWKGLMLGNYVIQEKLGQGGMGQVFKAHHKRMGRLVCIKVLRAMGRKSPEIVERFRREIKAISSLNHPNFVIAHDADEDEGIQFLVMEYIDGKDLSRLVKKQGPMLVNDGVEIIRQSARALEYAHQQGVIHRDIKPHNLLLTTNDENDALVKVLDMGLARFDSVFNDESDSGTQASMTATGVIMGTVDYISPEQALNSRNADGRSDIYSLGCTLHFILTGKPLFPGQTIMEKLINHRELTPPRLRDSIPEVSLGLEAIFKKMVAKDPEERYQSMTELAEDIDAFQAGRRPKALTSMWPALWNGIKSNPWPAVSSGAAVFIIGLAIWLFATTNNTAADQTAADSTSKNLNNAKNQDKKGDGGNFDGLENGGWAPGNAPLDQLMQQLRNDRPKVMVLVSHKDFDQNEVDTARKYLEKNNFKAVLASSKNEAYAKYSGKKVATLNFTREFSPNEYFGVLVTSVNRSEFKTTPVIKLLKSALQAEGVVAGVGSGSQLVGDMGLCVSQCLHKKENIEVDLDKDTRGSVIKAEAKHMEQVARYMQKLYSSSDF
jgi:serine/threonine protein kinase